MCNLQDNIQFIRASGVMPWPEWIPEWAFDEGTGKFHWDPFCICLATFWQHSLPGIGWFIFVEPDVCVIKYFDSEWGWCTLVGGSIRFELNNPIAASEAIIAAVRRVVEEVQR